jgi:hypothetical protein
MLGKRYNNCIVIVEEFQGLLKRLVAAVGAVDEMTERYQLYMKAGSYESAMEAKALIGVSLRIAFETIDEVETLDVMPSLQEIGLLVVLTERLRESKAALAEFVGPAVVEEADAPAPKKRLTVEN